MTKKDIRTVGARDLTTGIMRDGVAKSISRVIRLGPRTVASRLAFYGRLLRMHAYNLAYDLRHNTKTRRNLPCSELQASGDALDCAVWYTPVPVRTLRFVLKQQAIDYRQYTFIDYGAGMGRALLIASEFPFQKVVGLEFAHNLVQQAERNLAQATGLPKKRPNWEIQLGDAQDFQPPSGNCWFFLYAPFYGHVLKSVLDTIYQASQLDAEGAMLCFVDDGGGGGLVPGVVEYLEHWTDWQRQILPPLPADIGALYPLEVALYRKVVPASRLE